MSLADFFDRIGNNFATNFENGGGQGLASLGAAIASAPRNQWGAGIAQGLGQFKQIADQNKKKASLAEALKGVSGGFTPEQQTVFNALAEADPYKATELATTQAFAKPADKPNDIREYEFAKSQGFPGSFMEYQTSLRKSGASNTTINNIPAEFGAKVGLGEGFLRNYDDIESRIKKFYGTSDPVEQIKRRGQMAFNTGEGGKLWRDVELGKEALVRQLTGAGMPESEAAREASKYSISQWDTDYDALTKLASLKQSLIDSASGAYKARGGTYTPPKSNPASDHSDVDAILGLK